MTNPDVVVIGGGIYGCSTAYFLARFGFSVTLVDAADLGAGASGANAGNLHLQLSPFSHTDKSDAWLADFAQTLPFFTQALAVWKQLARELGADLELRCPGGIMVAENAEQLHKLEEKVSLERAHGLPISIIGQEALRRLAPYLSDRLLGATYCPDEGMANALAAVTALADSARAGGTTFLLNAPVTRLEEDDAGWIVTTSAATLRSRRVVIAAGKSSGAVAGFAGLHLPLAHRVIQMVATEACQPFVQHLIYHGEERLTLKQVAYGNILIGGGWSATEDKVFGRPAVLGESVVGSLALAQRIVPQLADALVIRTWAGPNIYTPDGRPIIGAVPGREGLFTAVCNTYGFTLGPLCGLLVAEMIAGAPPSYDATPFSPGRLSCRR